MSLSNLMPEKDKTIQSHRKHIYVEFARFFMAYMEAKEFLKNGHLLDSYNSVHQSLHHWARLAVIEVGERPELTVWEQLKTIDPSVYKLYEELATSQEPLDKRIELLLLALDFSVLSRMESCVQFLLDILRSRKEPWTVEEIIEQSDLADQKINVHLLLEKMLKRSLIKEESLEKEGLLEKLYTI